MNLRVAIALAFSVVSSLAAAGLDTIASGLVNAPAVSLHPSLDVTKLATTPEDLIGPRAFLADAVKNRRKLDTVMAPWTTPCPNLKGSWVRWLNPAGMVEQILFPAAQLRLPDADVATQIAAARAECASFLVIEAQLIAPGKATWFNPVAAATGDRAMLEGLRFVLSVDETTFLQVAEPPQVTVKEKKRDLWTGFFGGPKAATDYLATVRVRFALRDANGVPQIADSAKALALILVGPEGDVDRATLDLAKLPAALPLPPPPPTTPR